MATCYLATHSAKCARGPSGRVSPLRSAPLLALLLLAAAAGSLQPVRATPPLSDERLVFSTSFGNIEMAFYPDVAPVTVKHILKLAQLGAYNSNHFFRCARRRELRLGRAVRALTA